jgi:hypothetical protein
MIKTNKLAGSIAGAALLTASLCAWQKPAFAGDKALAEDLFRKAQSVMQRPKPSKDEIHQACQWFKESLDQDATQVTQVALAACWEKEGKPYSAWGMYSDVASGSGGAAEYAKTHADALLKAGFPKLKIEVKDLPEGSKVTLDGENVGAGSLNTERGADPGDHKLEVKAPGKKDFEKQFTLDAANSPLSVPVTLEDAPVVSGGGGGGGGGGGEQPVVQETSTVRTLGIIIGIAGVAAGAGALITEILAQVFDANSKSGQCKLDIMGCAIPEHNKAVGAQGAAIGLGIAGGALIVTGIVMYFVGAPKKAEPAKATWHFAPTAGPNSAGGMLIGTF